jgi:endoglucanase
MLTAEAKKSLIIYPRNTANTRTSSTSSNNEPVDDSWESLKDYAVQVKDVIRKNDPDNIILMGCPTGTRTSTLWPSRPYKGTAT